MGAVVSLVGESMLSFRVNQGLLLNEYTRKFDTCRTKDLQLDWDPIADENDDIARIMVTVRDVTELRKIQLAAKESRDALEILSILQSHDRADILDYMEEFRRLAHAVDEIIPTKTDTMELFDLQTVLRHVHTQKGNSRALNFQKIADLIHEFEEYIINLGQGNITAREFAEVYAKHCMARDAAFAGLRLAYQRFYSRIDAGEEKSLRLIGELKTSVLGLVDGGSIKEALKLTLARYESTSMDQVINAAAVGLAQCALRQQKEEPSLSIEGGELRLLAAHVPAVRSAFVHILSNCLDHGIEPAEARSNAGKDLKGTIRVKLKSDANAVFITIGDDGAGLDLERISIRGKELGLLKSSAKPDDMQTAELIFASSLSTALIVTQSSGRGVGMDAVRKTFAELGGSITIVFIGQRKESHQEFQFLIELPLSIMLTSRGESLQRTRMAA